MIFPWYHERPANCCKAVLSSSLGCLELIDPVHHLEEAGVALGQPMADRGPGNALSLGSAHHALAHVHLHVEARRHDVDRHHGVHGHGGR